MDEELLSLKGTISASETMSALLEYAFKHKSSDIHIDPAQTQTIVRMRTDGLLRVVAVINSLHHDEIISRLKVMSGLRTDEHAVPQDGKFQHVCAGGSFDVRVSIAPTYYGENAVLRLLENYSKGSLLDAGGFSQCDIQLLKQAVSKPSGLILSTGPTGSGKTTTLYALLEHIHTPEKSIITIEDPVEYAIDGVRHMQVNHRTGFTFSTGLRSILRQDPNVIMIGEIRDKDTSAIAIHAALTGHLIFSTLHTNDAVSAVYRLLDMGIDSYVLASTISLVISQRLVRRICTACIQDREVGSEVEQLFYVLFGNEASPLRRGNGCSECRGTGYKGRVVLCEILSIDKEISEAISDRISRTKLVALAQKKGMRFMKSDAEEKVRAGITTPEEVAKVLYE